MTPELRHSLISALIFGYQWELFEILKIIFGILVLKIWLNHVIIQVGEDVLHNKRLGQSSKKFKPLATGLRYTTVLEYKIITHSLKL